MAGATRQTLRDAVRDRAGLRNSSVFTDSILNGYLASAVAEFYDALTKAREHYHTTEDTLSASSGAASVALPSDFYRLVAVDRVDGDKHRPLRPFGIAQRHWQDDEGQPGWYRMQGSDLILAPKPASDTDLRLMYVPTAPTFPDDVTEVDFINGYEELVIDLTIRKVRIREQQDVTELNDEIAKQMARITSSSSDRDQGHPHLLAHYGEPGGVGGDDDEWGWWG